MIFKKALDQLPACLWGSLDLVGQHKTVKDLGWLAQHEVDLYDEGEDSDIRNPKQRDLCLRYARACGIEVSG